MIALLHHDSVAEHFLVAGGALALVLIVGLILYLRKQRIF
jgi:hypothetical protein